MGDRLDDLVARVARAIAAARRARGLSQEGLAALLGIAVKNVQRIESGKQNLSLATLERIASALQVEPASLMAAKERAVEVSRVPSALSRLEAAGYRVRSATARGRRPHTAVPVMTVRAAAGTLSGEARAVEILGWVVLPRSAASPEGQFVAEVHGRSMEPRLYDGALALFGPPPSPPFGDRLLLVAHEALHDPELGGPYAIKRVKPGKPSRTGRQRITLASINRAFPPITVDTSAGDELRVIAELVRVLVPGGRSPGASGAGAPGE